MKEENLYDVIDWQSKIDPTCGKVMNLDVENYIFVNKHEYNAMKAQLKVMFEMSDKLFHAYYGKNYYLPISGSQINVYEYLTDELIHDLRKNRFKLIWQRIKNRMKW